MCESDVSLLRADEARVGVRVKQQSLGQDLAELTMSRPQSCEEGGSSTCRRDSESLRRSKTPKMVALLAVSTLLAVTIVAVCCLALVNMEITKSFETLKDEHEAARRNFSEILSGMQSRPKTRPFRDELCVDCEEGWHQRGVKCYYFSTKRLNWNSSREKCREEGGDLVKVDSIDEQIFLEQQMQGYPTDWFWIGLTDAEEEGSWTWADGSPLNENLTFWHGHEPDNWMLEDPDGEDCVRTAVFGEISCWFTKSCKMPQKRICEKQTCGT